MRVISLVPSLTETLAECGVNLVGRTRFCVHGPGVVSVPAVGGTKDLNWVKLGDLAPDLLVLDREENLPWMKDEAPCQVFVFHAGELSGLPGQFRALAAVFESGTAVVDPVVRALIAVADRYQAVVDAPTAPWSWSRIPGALSIVCDAASALRLEYVIWRNPWMGIGPGTYIYSVLSKLGAGEFLPVARDGVGVVEKYPKFAMEAVPPETFLLFSSEPFPFASKVAELLELRDAEGRPRPCAVVDGESYSWFGVRGLRFLEAELGL